MVRQGGSLGSADVVSLDTALFVSLLLMVFAILFGTRHTDATEHQSGLILAVAMESVVKLLAFVAAGVFAIWVVFDGFGDLLTKAAESSYVETNFVTGIRPGTFAVFTFLSFCAFLLLPRQFHVGVVENHSQKELRAARWMFPLYLVLINLFVAPVALAGMLKFGQSADPDTYVLALPLANEATLLSLFVFIGGLSAATAMVIVACVALAIMLSNNIVLPLVLRRRHLSGASTSSTVRDMAPFVLVVRRTAIVGILACAFLYFSVAGDSAALASIGLLSFAAIAQFAPAFLGGMVWRRANSRGAIWAMTCGSAVWFYTLFLPTLLEPGSSILTVGLFGQSWLRPQSLLGLELDPLLHGVLVSIGVNLIVYVLASLSRQNQPIEDMQAATFAFYGELSQKVARWPGRRIQVAELRAVVATYLGPARSERAFRTFAANSGTTLKSRDLAGEDLINFAEQQLASGIGAASARLVMSLVLERNAQTSGTAQQLLDDASLALQENRGLLQTAIDQVEQGISAFDSRYHLSSWNRKFRTLLDLPPEFGQAGVPLARLAEYMEASGDWAFEGRMSLVERLLQTGEFWQLTHVPGQRTIEVSANTLPGGGLVLSWHDVTEREAAALALVEANESLERRVAERTAELTRLNHDLANARESAEAANIGKTRFLAAVGHDILQPLNAARLYSSSLKERAEGQPLAEMAGHIDASLESVEDILAAVLAISRLDAGALTPNVSVFSIASLFERLEVEFQPLAASKGLKLKVVSSQFAVKSDFNLLRRLLQNLVSNALKYTAKGSVTLDARLDKGEIVISVEDTGCGMSEEEQTVAFEEFRRLEAGKKAAPGLGLGLSIVRRLAATLDHELECQSSGHGTTFKLRVPLAEGVTISAEKSESTSSRKTSLGLKILCIDNEPTILDGMRSLLEGWDCVVLVAKDGEEAVALAREHPDIAVAIVDYHLDKEVGLDVIVQLRGVRGEDFPSILVTADRSAAVRASAKAMDVEKLNKPVKPAALRALLSRYRSVDAVSATVEDFATEVDERKIRAG